MNNEETGMNLNMSEDAANAPAETNTAELPENTAAEQSDSDNKGKDIAEKQELLDRISELEAELLKEQVKVKLLICGILPEKLEDGSAMAYGLCLAGKDTDTAAAEIMEAYPHLKAVHRDIPQFSAESTGSGDGFSAIRKIFSAR